MVWRLRRAGFPVLVTELAAPLTVRRTVALSTAVTDGTVDVEGLIGWRVATAAEAIAVLAEPDRCEVPVLVSPDLPSVPDDGPSIVVDARLAKRTLDTAIDDAPLVIALGPGFTAGVDCDVVIETQRGPRLGRALWAGSAAADTGTPSPVAGMATNRVVRAPAAGLVSWLVAIGDRVTGGQPMGSVGDRALVAPFDGVVRGLIRSGTDVPAELKIGDVDPRHDVDCHQISDKALAVGGGALEAAMTWLRRGNR